MTILEGIFYFCLGGLIGSVYFYLLHLTLQYLPKVKKPLRLLFLSAIGRFVGVGIIFFLLLQYTLWFALLIVLAGFLVVRTIILKLEKRKGLKK
ncbi:MAG: hypothetical protein JXR30_01820 [Alphaproteobacteria bacterium]|nr:hypothetical protein [Alphaproteobacteria bacterium]